MPSVTAAPVVRKPDNRKTPTTPHTNVRKTGNTKKKKSESFVDAINNNVCGVVVRKLDKNFTIPKRTPSPSTAAPPPDGQRIVTESPGIWRKCVLSKSSPYNESLGEKLKPGRVDDPTLSVSPGSTSKEPYKSKPGTSGSEAVDKPKMGPALLESPGTSSPESSKIPFDPEKVKNIKKECFDKLQEEASNIERTNRNDKYDKLIKKIRRSRR